MPPTVRSGTRSRRVDAPDATTVVIRTKAPFSQLPNSLAHGSGAMVSPAAIQKFGDTGIAQNPVGAGPYMLDSFRPGQELTLKAFDGYWGDKAGAERIVFRFIAEPATRISALRTGAVDVIELGAGAAGRSSSRSDPQGRDPAPARPAADGVHHQPDARAAAGRAGAPGAQSRGAGADHRRAGVLRLRQGAELAARLRHRRPQGHLAGRHSTRRRRASCSPRPATRLAPAASWRRTASRSRLRCSHPRACSPATSA